MTSGVPSSSRAISEAYFCTYVGFTFAVGAVGSTAAVPVTTTMSSPWSWLSRWSATRGLRAMCLSLAWSGMLLDQQARAVPGEPDGVRLRCAVLANRDQPADAVFTQPPLGADTELGAGVDQRLHVRDAFYSCGSA